MPTMQIDPRVQDRQERPADRPQESPQETENAALVVRAQSGDRHAFSALVESQSNRIYRAALRITRNHADAEDVCQDGMMKAFLNIREFQGRSRFSTWLMRIVINEALMKIRKRQTEARHISSEGRLSDLPIIAGMRDRRASADPEALCTRAEKNNMLWQAIRRLEIKSKIAVCLYGFEGQGTGEMAKTFGMSRSGVKSRLSRAVGQLRVMVSERLSNGIRPTQDPA